jgi:hypothetical protein
MTARRTRVEGEAEVDGSVVFVLLLPWRLR